MKIFSIVPEQFTSGQYRQVIVVAENAVKALHIAYKDEYFDDDQLPLTAIEIPLDVERVVSTDFCNK